MTRPVRAVLIAVPDTAWAPGRTFTRASSTADALGGLLERRFSEATIVRVTPETGPVTKAAVAAAFAQAGPARGELLVVMFCGHGLPPDEARPRQAWALTTEALTDLELAAELRRLPPGVDIVVIAACCHARGLPMLPVELPPMVCISAARYVLRAVAAQLVTEVIAAAEQGLSYRELDEKFRRERFAGREFHVDARPAERLAHLVLAT